MHQTRRAGVLTASGLAVAASIWSSAALVGLSAVFAGTPWLYNGLRIVGGIYLFYLGIGMLRQSCGTSATAWSNPQINTDWTAFWLGLFTSLANPKALLFFAGLFTALLPHASSLDQSCVSRYHLPGFSGLALGAGVVLFDRRRSASLQ
jgi:threonine/homoserine/homoserine lactone efflux protein